MIIRKSEALTNRAKEIFGEDIVEAAYMTTGQLEDRTWKLPLSVRLDGAGLCYHEKMIDISDVYIIIEFKNGKKVGFTAHEYGNIFVEKSR